MTKLLLMILGTVAFLIPSYVLAIPTTIDFESLSDSDIVTNQFAGLAFSNTIALTAGISLNEFEFPPQSGSTVVSDNGGPITIDFATLQGKVDGFFTYTTQLTLTAFDGSNTNVSSVTSAFGSNPALSGDVGSAPNEHLSVAFAAGIDHITITGDPSGASFTLDDLTFTPTSTAVPEPATLLLLGSGLAALVGCRVRGWRRVAEKGRKPSCRGERHATAALASAVGRLGGTELVGRVG
jgi:hypothetical protein